MNDILESGKCYEEKSSRNGRERVLELGNDTTQGSQAAQSHFASVCVGGLPGYLISPGCKFNFDKCIPLFILSRV